MRRIHPAPEKIRKLTIVASVLVGIHAAAFLVFWLGNAAFYADTNAYLSRLLGRELDYIRLCLWLATGSLIWSVVVSLRPTGAITWTTWLFLCAGFIFLLFFYGSFTMLFQEAPAQKVRILQLGGYYRWLLDALLLVVLSAIATRHPGQRVPLSIGILLVWAGALVFPAAAIYRGALPARPHLIAHRGASGIAPENTNIAARLAGELGAYGLETDVRISLDGHLFLMHDETLKRTTNITSVFPKRMDEPAANFTLAELQRLDAGSWFEDKTRASVQVDSQESPFQVNRYRGQRIPSLSDWLEIVRDTGQVFIFDLKAPPSGHPYQSRFFQQALAEIQSAQIDEQIWFLVNESELAKLQAEAPGMQPAAGVSYAQPPRAIDLAQLGYRVVNAEYALPTSFIHQYQRAGLWVNLYTVDETWQFSRLWLLGADSTTTNQVSTFDRLERPHLALSYSFYVVLWSLLGLLCLAAVWLPGILRVNR